MHSKNDDIVYTSPQLSTSDLSYGFTKKWKVTTLWKDLFWVMKQHIYPLSIPLTKSCSTSAIILEGTNYGWFNESIGK